MGIRSFQLIMIMTQIPVGKWGTKSAFLEKKYSFWLEIYALNDEHCRYICLIPFKL